MYIGINQSYMNRLQTVQNADARLLTGTRKYEHITPVLLSLHWLPFHFKIEFKIKFFVFKVLNGLAPLYLSDLLSLRSPGRCLRSLNQKLLLVPRPRLKKKGDWVFAIAGPKLWNSLPVSIRTIPTESLFKTRLKACLFERAFDVWANRSLLFQIIIYLFLQFLCILNLSKLHCSAQWSTSVVLLCFINKINTKIKNKNFWALAYEYQLYCEIL